MKRYKWYKIADTVSKLQFGKNNMIEVEAGGKNICLVKIVKGFAACAAKCPHAGGAMSEGFLDKNDNIVCPIHRYVFNLGNGRNVTGEGYHLKIYPVEVNAEGVFLGIEEHGLFNWLK